MAQDIPRSESPACLNCGSPLTGSFCAMCGQRDVPAFPTIREAAGEAWEELSGWDGRFVRTLATLFRRPGRLTIEMLEGRRARYIKPLRLYLTASVIYFVVAAASPNVGRNTRATIPGEGRITVDLMDERGMAALSPEERETAERAIKRAPPLMRPVFEAVLHDPRGFRNRMIVAVPRLMFALVPVFALILALFYRRRRYMQHLTFALHAHALVFLTLTIADLPQFTRNLWLVTAVGWIALAFIAWYLLRALRQVYGGGWAATVVKTAGAAVVYVIVFVPALIVTVVWATLVR